MFKVELQLLLTYSAITVQYYKPNFLMHCFWGPIFNSSKNQFWQQVWHPADQENKILSCFLQLFKLQANFKDGNLERLSNC
jgi:hypothetical protein